MAPIDRRVRLWSWMVHRQGSIASRTATSTSPDCAGARRRPWPNCARSRPRRSSSRPGPLPRRSTAGEPRATATRLLPADQAVYHDAAHPSAVILPVRQAQ
jgi:uncharacterized protein